MDYLIKTREWIPREVAQSRFAVRRGGTHSRGRYSPWQTVEVCKTYEEAVGKIEAWFRATGYPGVSRPRILFHGGDPFAITPDGVLSGDRARYYWLSRHPP